MNKLVTIGIPVYKRLEYLPNVLKIVASQDYPHIDLLVSDNGLNGATVPAIVDEHYPKPYRFRQNSSTVSGSNHFNQLIHDAIGEYVVILADDDEISPNYVSELLRLLEIHPEASAAFGVEEVIDAAGNLIRSSKNTVPEILSGEDFIRTTWSTREYGFESVSTFLATKEKLIECGGFPDTWAGTSDEDVLTIKLSLDSCIAFSTQCAFRKRFYETSGGYAIELQDLARGIREYLACLDSDPRVLEYSALHPTKWNKLRSSLIKSAWDTYRLRWGGMYKQRMPLRQWVQAGFAVPFPSFQAFSWTLSIAAKSVIVAMVEQLCPKAYTLYRAAKTRLRRNGIREEVRKAAL